MNELWQFATGLGKRFIIAAIGFLCLAGAAVCVWHYFFPGHVEWESMVALFIGLAFLTVEIGFTLRHLHDFSVIIRAHNTQLENSSTRRLELQIMRMQDTVINNQSTYFNIILKKL
jgi:hypothetical protein